ncbi:MAG: hypothetical protein ACOH2V_00185 [Candidatus Saccharimonadaceae bacterium]
MKEMGLAHWVPTNTGTNASGFTARGSSYRDDKGTFGRIKEAAYYATSSMADTSYWAIKGISAASTVFQNYGMPFRTGVSIRGLKLVTTLTNGQTGFYVGNDGKVYKTICIGTQEWMLDNLAETKYKDGSTITIVNNPVTWGTLITEAGCAHNNDITNI